MNIVPVENLKIPDGGLPNTIRLDVGPYYEVKNQRNKQKYRNRNEQK